MRLTGALAILVVVALAPVRTAAAADTDQGDTQSAALDAPAPAAEISRSEWQRRIEEAKQRAQSFRMMAKAGYLEPAPSTGSSEQEASAAVLSDQSLQPGDIVSTVDGLFVYHGRYGADPKPTDFEPAPRDLLDRLK